ncbi:uncharacterized protein A1O9_01529 [Exophiala aquamarina CBS 119918]|uniref:CBM-cenC domain-containing protein n=1 Tax=Exophiala aquamarina CBS 119918 TaxID=1182545 RepID=A0A072PUL3_9EURO|nr:uncharacterized protein A1O9_01529 [Exophiala aquamarina CBS 119918]KEF63551.1 hypothetical protein A1O9_01529 [Exophiala aquamarina CBS 119918]
MLPFFYFLLFTNLVLGSLGEWDAYVPWKKNILERDIEPTCSCTDPAAREWSSDKHFSDTAVSAVAPSGYTQTISNAHTWTTGDGFLGVVVIDEYDVATGAFLCDSLDACSSFQIYFEKEEESEAVIKAAFWAGAFAAADSTTANAVVAGLNGYTNNTLATPDGFEVPSYVGNQAIRPPPGSNSFIDSKIFHGPFDTAHCSKQCDVLGGKFFNTYVVAKNGVNQGQYCDVYTDAIGHEWATESGSTVGRTNWTISHSFTCKWAGEKRGEDLSRSSTATSTTTIVQGGGKKGSWEHHHPWHGNGPRATTTSFIASTTSKSSSSIPAGVTTTTWGSGTFTHPHGSSSTIPHGSSSSFVDPIGHGSTTSTSSTAITTSTPGHPWPHDTTSSQTISSHSTMDPHSSHSTTDPHLSHTTTDPHPSHTTTDPHPSGTTTDPYPSHTTTDPYPSHATTDPHPSGTTTDPHPSYTTTDPHSSHTSTDPHTSGTATDPHSSHTTTDPHLSHTTTPSQPATTSTPNHSPTTTPRVLRTTSHSVTTLPPGFPGHNTTTGAWLHGNHTGSEWLDWLETSSRSTSTLVVDPATSTLSTTSNGPFTTTSTLIIPSHPVYNGSHGGNGTNHTWGDWLDWNRTLSSSTTSTLFVDPAITSTTTSVAPSTSQTTTTSVYPSIPPFNGSYPHINWTDWSSNHTNGSHWYDWVFNGTTTTSFQVEPQTTTATTTSLVPVDPATTSTTTSAYPSIPVFNGSYPHLNWTDWSSNHTNSSHWYDWVYNGTSTTSASIVDPATTTWSLTTVTATPLTTSTSGYIPTPPYNGTHPWNGTLPNGTHWYDWIYNETTSLSTISTLVVGPETTTTSSAYLTTTTTGAAYPPTFPHNGTLPNGTHPWNGTLPNGTHWYDWLYNETTTSLSTTTSAFVAPVTTTTSEYVTLTSAYPTNPPFNGTLPNGTHWTDWNGTLPNGTHWYDWLYNGTTTSLITTTTSTLLVDPFTTTTTTSAGYPYPTGSPFNGTLPNGTHWTDWNGTLPNGTHWYDWLNNETTSSLPSTTTSSLFIEPTTSSTTTVAYITTSRAYPSGIPYNGTLPNGTHWTDWNITLPFNGTLPNGTHWYDWLYNGTSTTSAITTTTSLYVDPATTTTNFQTTTSAYPAHPSFNGTIPNITWADWNGTLPNGTHWYDWLYNGTSSSAMVPTTTSTLVVDPLTTTTTALTTSAYPTYPSFNGSLPNGTHWTDWNGTLPNGTHWYDWLYNGTSSSMPISTTTSTLFVGPATTTTTPLTTTAAVPIYPAYNGSLPNGTHWTDWNGTLPLNGTLPNGTHWYDWLYNGTSSSTTISSTTPSTLIVEPATTSTSTISAYPTYPSFNGTIPNGTWADWNGTLPNGTHWYDWLYNGTTSSIVSTTTTSITPLATTTTGAYPHSPAFNGSLPNGTHWTDWNGTIPLNGTLPNGTHWYDWLYNATTSSKPVSTTTSTLFVKPSTTSLLTSSTTNAYPSHSPVINGTLPNGTHWTDWNGTIPLNGTSPNGTHWYDWLYNGTTSSSTSVVGAMTTRTTWTYATPTTTGLGSHSNTSIPSFPHNGTQGNSSFPAFPPSNNSYPQSNASWVENGCDPTPPSQILKNPSFECSLGGWTLQEGDVVWGGLAAPAKKKRKTRKRDIASPDLASNGKGFVRLHPSSSDTATLSQVLDTAAPNGSYWYSFDYRVPTSGDTPAECTLTVSDDEGVLQVLSGLGSATGWTKTGNEFEIKESAASFSWAFTCNGVDTGSALLDLDNLRLGTSNGTWTPANGTIGGAPPSNGTYGGPPVNGTYTTPPPQNLTFPTAAPPPPPASITIPSPPPSHSDSPYSVPTTSSGPSPSATQSTSGPDPNTLNQNTPPPPEPAGTPGNSTTAPPDRRFRPRRWKPTL